MTKILRLPELKEATGLSRSTLYSRVKNGLLPKAVNLGPRAVGWPLKEIEEILNATIAGQPDEQIRLLVTKLEAERKTFGSRNESCQS